MFLLLGFRANQAYNRFWEGRRAWGRMREVARDFTRLVCTHVRVETKSDCDDRRRAVAFVTAFSAATKLHLRKERDIHRDLIALASGDLVEIGDNSTASSSDEDGILWPQDAANLQNAKHMPLFCLDILSDYLSTQYRAGKLTDYQMGVIHSTTMAVMSVSCHEFKLLLVTPNFTA